MKLLGFEVSRTKNKKYDALVEDNGKVKRVPFGDKRYQQYKDTTGIGAYTHLNHNDQKRRELYHKRHANEESKKFSPSWLSKNFLW
jgi:hypothetical protein